MSCKWKQSGVAALTANALCSKWTRISLNLNLFLCPWICLVSSVCCFTHGVWAMLCWSGVLLQQFVSEDGKSPSGSRDVPRWFPSHLVCFLLLLGSITLKSTDLSARLQQCNLYNYANLACMWRKLSRIPTSARMDGRAGRHNWNSTRMLFVHISDHQTPWLSPVSCCVHSNMTCRL